MTRVGRILPSFLLGAIASSWLFAPTMVLSQTGASRGAAILDSMPRARRIQQAEISPDGKRAAYIIDGKLTVASLDDNSAKTIEVEGQLPLRSVAWSADSKQLVFLADLPTDAPSAQLWTAAIDAAAPIKRADLKGNADAPSFSPDGSKLAVLFVEGMPRAAGPLQPMTPLTGVVGSKVYEQRVATVDLASNTLTQVTPADMYIYEYDWTPDGQSWIATAAHGSGDANWYIAHLYRIETRSGEMHDIYAPKLQIAGPRVSPDGKSVAFIEGLMSDEGPTGGDIFVVPIAGGTSRNLTPKINSSPSAIAWTAPNRITFAENIDGESGLATVNAARRLGPTAVARRRIHRHQPLAQCVVLSRRNNYSSGAAIRSNSARSLGRSDRPLEANHNDQRRHQARVGRTSKFSLDEWQYTSPGLAHASQGLRRRPKISTRYQRAWRTLVSVWRALGLSHDGVCVCYGLLRPLPESTRQLWTG